MAIIIERSCGLWVAVRDIKLELATPRFNEWSDLGSWLLRKYPDEPIGILTEDIAGERGAIAAQIVTGSTILWLRGRR